EDEVSSVAFSPDGTKVVTGSKDDTARMWDAATGQILLSFVGHANWVLSVAFSPDGRKVLTSSLDQTTRLWNSSSITELCGLISFDDGTWAVVDPEGRYDASNGGDIDGLHWVYGDEPYKLSQFKDRYYDPYLLAKYLGFSVEPLRPVAGFDHFEPEPEI